MTVTITMPAAGTTVGAMFNAKIVVGAPDTKVSSCDVNGRPADSITPLMPGGNTFSAAFSNVPSSMNNLVPLMARGNGGGTDTINIKVAGSP